MREPINGSDRCAVAVLSSATSVSLFILRPALFNDHSANAKDGMTVGHIPSISGEGSGRATHNL